MTTKALTLPAVPVDEGLSAYFRSIWKFPILDAEEEYMLAVRWRDQGDVAAAHRLVTSHLRLVAKIAMKYRGYGLPLSDLVAEGNIGLMKAVKKFEPERGFRLATYAIWWIKASITEYVLRSWSLVKMGTLAAQKKLFFSLRRLKSSLKISESGDLTPADAETLARRLDVDAQDVVDMNRRFGSRDVSLNAPVSDGENAPQFQDSLADDRVSAEEGLAEGQEALLRRRLLLDALATLSERDRLVLEARRLSDDPVTLDELGGRLGISRERVRQIENRAFEKVQKAVLGAVA
ncbi:MAG: RNA polymerase sigma factor RpoH [Magnetospirillum sp. WYHS-4]